jgi:two-component system, OmpR family, response regulator CpxR
MVDTSVPTTPAPVSSGMLLLIDDDVELCTLMAEYFARQSYHVECVHNGRDGLARALDGKYDLIILDVMLPVLDGFEVLHQLRKRSTVPVIMLTARTRERDRIAGLDTGADDYLPKPFGPDELMARIRAVLRRFDHGRREPVETIRTGSLELNSRNRGVRGRNGAVEVTEIEYEILELLLRNAGRTVTRDEITAVLYQRESTPYERSLDVHVSHLRKKLEDEGISIRNMRGVGYSLVLSEEASS